MQKEETNKQRVVIDLTTKELKELAKFAGLQSDNSGNFILRAFLSTFLMNLPKNRIEGKSSRFKLNTTFYEKKD